MKEVKTKIEKLKEEISSIEDNRYKEIFDSILSIVSDISDSIEEIDYKQDSLEENIKYIDEDIIGLQDELFEEEQEQRPTVIMPASSIAAILLSFMIVFSFPM